MKEVFVSWEDQMDFMENIAGATGSTCIENIRGEMSDGLRWEHGQYTVFNYEEIPEAVYDEFVQWLEEDEGEIH